tara:strand:+ start:637 stop:855 length:219 start_codon:yes stop_codon:yes gene_type:complete
MRLTKWQALFIKSMRVNRGYSWSAVYSEFIDRYTFRRPFTGLQYREGNIVDGMYLCETAMNKLNEKKQEAWI